MKTQIRMQFWVKACTWRRLGSAVRTPEEVEACGHLVVLSPGVPTDIPVVQEFYDMGLPVWGEVELAYRTGKGRVLAITGTNGKTTTTALLGKIMSDAEESVLW